MKKKMLLEMENLSTCERVILCNQYRILEKIDADNSDYYKDLCNIVASGDVYNLYRVLEDIEEKIPKDVCDEVIDVLEMYMFLTEGYDELSSKEKQMIDKWHVQFHGYDSNSGDEMFFFRYVCHLKRLKCFDGFFGGVVKNADIVPHVSMIEKYRRMLSKWKPIHESIKEKVNMRLTAEQIKTIIEADSKGVI